MKDKFLNVTFKIKVVEHISMQEGADDEDKLKRFKERIEEALTDEIRHWGEISLDVECIEQKIEEL